MRLGFPLAEEMWMQVGYTLKRDEIFDVDTQLVDRREAGVR